MTRECPSSFPPSTVRESYFFATKKRSARGAKRDFDGFSVGKGRDFEALDSQAAVAKACASRSAVAVAKAAGAAGRFGVRPSETMEGS